MQQKLRKILKANKKIDLIIECKVKDFIKFLLETILNIEIEIDIRGITKKSHRERNGYFLRRLLRRFGLIE